MVGLFGTDHSLPEVLGYLLVKRYELFVEQLEEYSDVLFKAGNQ